MKKREFGKSIFEKNAKKKLAKNTQDKALRHARNKNFRFRKVLLENQEFGNF